ncbi:hypothetical protein GCM10011314_21180 [Knoellia flava]|uniref:Uncharacterized protein n=1 Tax=Knoellia flava TaxID=913969 RepID=A0A8H9FU18_9MICO|nr:hypothetical protein GCM10011314_21180 [Knoellia flava]
MASVTRHLWRAIDLKLSEILQFDLWVGVAGGAGAVAAALVAPSALLNTLGVASQVMGIVVGAVIAGVSIQAAFFDQAFLRKLRAISRDPVSYLAPFLFTAVLGVAAMIGMLVLSALTPTTIPAVLATIGGITGLLTVWALASILPCLATLVQFIGLKVAALDVPDDIDVQIKPKRAAEG